ncbi:MAG: 50S ribosomal protein L39e [Candidatus Micrarchaeota archaeon]
MGAKGLTKKKRLAKAAKKIRRIPAFVIIRTKRKVSYNRQRRDWRTEKLRISDEE